MTRYNWLYTSPDNYHIYCLSKTNECAKGSSENTVCETGREELWSLAENCISWKETNKKSIGVANVC